MASSTASTTLRVTDQVTGATGDQPGTVQDVPFEFGVPCTRHARSRHRSRVSVSTTADAVTPGIADEGSKLRQWALGQWQLLDGDQAVFARQGDLRPVDTASRGGGRARASRSTGTASSC